MTAEKIADDVLYVLSAATEPLTAEEIRLLIQPNPELRDVRIALRNLAQAGDVHKEASDRWSAVGKAPQPRTPVGHDFTSAELQHARRLHGTTSECPSCGKRGDIDRLFG